ncbi:MAG: hypothetical protein P8M13_10705 [Luminiphilus sp.]|nr:hypothetical protein [Luminiphilus sp.]
MFSSAKQSAAQVGEFFVGFCFLAMISTSVSATEYRLFVDDAAACSSAGKTGSVCVVEVGATTSSSATATTSTPTTATTSTPTTATTPVGGSVETGDLDFGSGGGNSGVSTYFVSVTNDTIAYPFTVKQGAFYGSVGIYPSSKPYPTDGSEIRLWWSKAKGGEPLAGAACHPRIGRESKNSWDQSGKRGYGCPIENIDSTIYLNLRACISASDDTTSTAPDAKVGSAVPTYIGGRVNELR